MTGPRARKPTTSSPGIPGRAGLRGIARRAPTDRAKPAPENREPGPSCSGGGSAAIGVRPYDAMSRPSTRSATTLLGSRALEPPTTRVEPRWVSPAGRTSTTRARRRRRARTKPLTPRPRTRESLPPHQGRRRRVQGRPGARPTTPGGAPGTPSARPGRGRPARSPRRRPTAAGDPATGTGRASADQTSRAAGPVNTGRARRPSARSGSAAALGRSPPGNATTGRTRGPGSAPRPPPDLGLGAARRAGQRPGQGRVGLGRRRRRRGPAAASGPGAASCPPESRVPGPESGRPAGDIERLRQREFACVQRLSDDRALDAVIDQIPQLGEVGQAGDAT